MIKPMFLYKKLIFCFLFYVNNIFGSFFPSVNVEWKEERNQKIQKKLAEIPIPKEIECNILRFCNLGMLKKITETSKSGKELIGYLCKNQGSVIYELIKKHPHTYDVSRLGMDYEKCHMHMDWYKPLNLFKTLLVVVHKKSPAFKNNQNTLLRYLELDGSPLRAFAYTIIDKVIIDSSCRDAKGDLLFSYIKKANCIEFRSHDLKNEEKYIHAMQENTYLEKITFKGDSYFDLISFPNLSKCTSLTYLCIDYCTDTIDWRSLSKIPNLMSLEIHMSLQNLPLLLNILPQLLNLKTILMAYNFSATYNEYDKKLKKIYYMFDILSGIKTLKNLEIVRSSYTYKRSFSEVFLKYYKYKEGVFSPFLESYIEEELIKHYTEKLQNFFPVIKLKAFKINFFEYYHQILCWTSETEQTIQIIVFKENFEISTCKTEKFFELINNQHCRTIIYIKNNTYKKINNTNCILAMLSSFNVLGKIEYCIIKSYLRKTRVLNKELIKQELNKIKIDENLTGNSSEIDDNIIDKIDNNINCALVNGFGDSQNKTIGKNLEKDLESETRTGLKAGVSEEEALPPQSKDQGITGKNKKKILKNYGFIDIFLSQMKYLFFVVFFLYLKEYKKNKLSEIFNKTGLTNNTEPNNAQ